MDVNSSILQSIFKIVWKSNSNYSYYSSVREILENVRISANLAVDFTEAALFCFMSALI